AVVRLTPMVAPKTVAATSPQTEVAQEPSAPAPTETETTEAEVDDQEEEQELALDLLRTLLEKMHVDATITVGQSEPDDLTGRQIVLLEIQGNDLGVLIGSRGETLNAIQYITRLMVGHKLRRRVDFVIDVEGYRQRREQALSRLAERMADKVMKRRRPISLEPMPPHERRIIHITLRDYDEVTTYSVGEGKRRKVRILPK
ncbi:MAG TPA: RNA-binding cell elongation regulator Jag/EloR, partial [Anaerolineae bacterium]